REPARSGHRSWPAQRTARTAAHRCAGPARPAAGRAARRLRVPGARIRRPRRHRRALVGPRWSSRRSAAAGGARRERRGDRGAGPVQDRGVVAGGGLRLMARWFLGPPAWKDLEAILSDRPAQVVSPPVVVERTGQVADDAYRPARTVDYAELHAHSHFSFLDGASSPEDMVEQAARLGLGAITLV